MAGDQFSVRLSILLQKNGRVTNWEEGAGKEWERDGEEQEREGITEGEEQLRIEIEGEEREKICFY